MFSLCHRRLRNYFFLRPKLKYPAKRSTGKWTNFSVKISQSMRKMCVPIRTGEMNLSCKLPRQQTSILTKPIGGYKMPGHCEYEKKTRFFFIAFEARKKILFIKKLIRLHHCHMESILLEHLDSNAVPLSDGPVCIWNKDTQYVHTLYKLIHTTIYYDINMHTQALHACKKNIHRDDAYRAQRFTFLMLMLATVH